MLALPRPLTEIRNVGPATAAAFARGGLTDADALAAMGADAAYALWLASGNAPHFIGYYALVMGLQGRPWNDCRGAEKVALRIRFDTLKAAARPANALERALDEIGLGTKRR